MLQLRVFALTWVGYASYYFTRKNLSVVKSRLHVTLHISTTALGAVETLYLAAYALGQFVSGAVGDRIGARKLLTIGMLGTALAAKDKLEIKRCRKRILELDPDNESVFEMRAEPLRDAPAKEAPKTVMMTAPPTLRLLDDKPSRWPLVLTFLLGALAGVLVTVVALKLQSRI